MLTPAFELSQNEEYLIILIRAPFAKVSETEIFIDESEFKFYSKPYYLRLNLPGKIKENGGEKAKYDCDAGTFTVTVPKQTTGEVFEGLDMLTKLLAPSGGQSAQQPLVEVLDDSANQNGECNDTADQDEEEEFDWQIEQEPYTSDKDSMQFDAPSYGFGNMRTAVFKRLQTELHDIIDLPNADNTHAGQRQSLRIADEQQHFDDEHYLSDLHENHSIAELLSYKPPWVEEYIRITAGAKADDVVKFTDEEKEKMRKLPRKEYMLDATNTQKTLLGLVDIMFAYCYNHRTTEGESTVESSWTVAKLSATLSWLQSFSSLRDVVVTGYRRSLCYPLYRHWELTRKVFKDTQKIFTIGKRRLLRCLLEIHTLLMESDPQYILNDLYITDYCVWIQSVSSRQLDYLARSLIKLKVTKEDMGFDLDIVERAASLALAEDQSANEIIERVQHLNIGQEHEATSGMAGDVHPVLCNDHGELTHSQLDADNEESSNGVNICGHSRAEGKCHCGNSEGEKCTVSRNCHNEKTLPSESSNSESDSDESDSETSSSEYVTESDDMDSDDSIVNGIGTHKAELSVHDEKTGANSQDNLHSENAVSRHKEEKRFENPLHKLTDDSTLNF